MITILGAPQRYCDGVSRRSFLKIGGLSMGAVGGIGLADILRAEDAAGVKSNHKSVINIFLGGGPPHQDMWEIKTEAPSEIRGPFVPISTKVTGVQIGECFPKIASMMDKFVAFRAVVGCEGGHDSFQCFSGWGRSSLASMGGRPSIGSVIAKLKGPVDRGIPPTVALAAPTSHRPWSYPGGPGFLGSAYQPFQPDGEGLANLTLNGVTVDRLEDRKLLLKSLDGLKREVDANGVLDGIDSFNEAAFGVLTSSKLLQAMDLSQESDETRARYGDGKPYQFQYDGAPTVNEHFLMARRLVEAGVRSVTLSYGRWDSHGDNFGLVRDHGTKLDQGVTALVQDLDERGMLDDVTVVVWGEFGRTPRINSNSGRDHWPQVSCALLAGGGMKTGQAIGATNRLGEYAVERPTHMQEIVATIFHNMGIDASTTRLIDPAGRPQQLLDHTDPIREVV